LDKRKRLFTRLYDPHYRLPHMRSIA